MEFTTLLFELDADGIAVATVNRPDKMNALNAAVIADLAALAERIAMDNAIKGVVLTGAGPKAWPRPGGGSGSRPRGTACTTPPPPRTAR